MIGSKQLTSIQLAIEAPDWLRLTIWTNQEPWCNLDPVFILMRGGGGRWGWGGGGGRLFQQPALNSVEAWHHVGPILETL